MEEQLLRPKVESGPQRDLLSERAQEILDRAVLAAGGQDEDAAEPQQLSNRMAELLGKRAEQPRKKTRVDADAPDADLPAVPETRADESDDEDMGQENQNDYQGPIKTTSEKILAQYSTKATREYLRNKGPYEQAAGKGGKKGTHNGPTPPWGKGPTPAEAHGPKQPGIQSPEGGEGDAGTATPVIRAESPPAARDEPSRNQRGDGHPL